MGWWLRGYGCAPAGVSVRLGKRFQRKGQPMTVAVVISAGDGAVPSIANYGRIKENTNASIEAEIADREPSR